MQTTGYWRTPTATMETMTDGAWEVTFSLTSEMQLIVP